MTTATKTVKAPNYTAEQVAIMREQYLAAPNSDTVAKLATELGKSVRSIVARLSREKREDGKTSVYVAKSYVTKQGVAPVKKDELADQVGALARLTEPETESLTKVNKTALTKILALMTKPVSADDAQSDMVLGNQPEESEEE